MKTNRYNQLVVGNVIVFLQLLTSLKRKTDFNERHGHGEINDHLYHLKWLSKADSMFKDEASPCQIAVARVHVMTSGSLEGALVAPSISQLPNWFQENNERFMVDTTIVNGC